MQNHFKTLVPFVCSLLLTLTPAWSKAQSNGSNTCKPIGGGRVISGVSGAPKKSGIASQTQSSSTQATQHKWQPNPNRGYPQVWPLLYPGMRYRLIDYFGRVKFCDPYLGGACHTDLERQHARIAFAKIEKDQRTLAAIEKHLGWKEKTDFSDDDKLATYREYLKLRDAVRLLPAESGYCFELLYSDAKSQNGFRVSGAVSPGGTVHVLRKEPAPVWCSQCVTNR